MYKWPVKWMLFIAVTLLTLPAIAEDALKPAEQILLNKCLPKLEGQECALLRKCMGTLSIVNDDLEAMPGSCEKDDDCVVIAEHCLPIITVSKGQLNDEKVKTHIQSLRNQRMEACGFVYPEDETTCKRNIAVRCENHICTGSDIYINPSAFKETKQ